MSNINSRPVHDPARDRRHLRRRRLHALDRHRGRHGHAGARRQRLRCRRRHGLHAAGGGAAPVRARRRRAGDALRREGAASPRSSAARARRRPAPPSPTIAAISASTSCRAPGCCRPAFRAPSRPTCWCCATTAPCACATCWSRPSATPRTAIRWSSAPAPPSPPSPSSSASTGRPRPRSICRAARCPSPARCSPTVGTPRPTSAS